MQLYIEYVIIDNCVIDYILLRLIDLSVGVKSGKRNKIIICLIGTLFALFLPYLHSFKMLIILYKIITSFILVLCIKKYKNFKEFFTYYLLFITYTFLIGGACLGIIQILGIDYKMDSLILYNFEFPMGIFLLIFFVILNFIRILVLLLKNKLNKSNFIYDVVITDGCITKKIIGYFDSGNNVNIDNRGVVIISINLFLQLHKDIDLNKLLLHKLHDNMLCGMNYLSISGIGDSQKYLSYIIDSLEVEGHKFDKPRIAVALKNFDNFDCVLHKDFIRSG